MVRAVSCWPLTAKGQIRSGASPCSLWDFWWIIWECYRFPPPPVFWFSTLNTASLILHTHSVIISKCSMIVVSSWLKIYTECTLIIRVNEPYQVPLEREVNVHCYPRACVGLPTQFSCLLQCTPMFVHHKFFCTHTHTHMSVPVMNSNLQYYAFVLSQVMCE